jgi:hypothetical protein
LVGVGGSFTDLFNINKEIYFQVLGTFFYRKKVPNLQKPLGGRFKTLGRCPKPHPVPFVCFAKNGIP